MESLSPKKNPPQNLQLTLSNPKLRFLFKQPGIYKHFLSSTFKFFKYNNVSSGCLNICDILKSIQA